MPLLAVIALFSGVGCSGDAGPKVDDSTQDLNQIARAYSMIVTGKNRPPKDVSEIRAILTDLHAADINPPPDEVLVSSRDGQPYVIIMGANLGGVSSGDILAYEKTGAEGKRYALLMSRDVQQVTDEEFRQATFAMGHRPGK